MNLGRAIKMCRTQRGLSQGQLAKVSGCSLSYLSLLENNQRDPSLSVLEGIAAGLRVPVSILFFLASDSAELKGMDKEMSRELSRAALELLSEPIPDVDTEEPDTALHS
jgi:transcriptional regulator with XRE-family HTH domain